MTEPDQPPEPAVRALRDLTEAVCAVAGRMLGLPDKEDPR